MNMSLMYKIVYSKLVCNENNSAFCDGFEICCLCHEPIGKMDEAFHVSDDIYLEARQEAVLEKLSDILLTLIGDNFAETMELLKTICKQCSESALSSYKFIKKCKEKNLELIETIENMESCFENTVDLEDFKSLYASVNTESNKIEQFYDNMKLISPKETALSRFLNIAYGDTPKQKRSTYMQRDCSTIFIKTHELVYDPSKPTEFKCKMCLKDYPSAGSLRQHFFSTHFKKEFQCSVCSKAFGTAGRLQSHISQSHQTINCRVCDKTLLNRKSTIKRHELSHSKALKMCNRCGRSYKKTTDFEKHMAQETCEMPSRIPADYRCEHCNYRCHFKHQMSSHIKFEHLDAPGFVCSWCSKKCYSKSSLKTHILKHTGEKNFACNQCGGKFVTLQSLMNHTRLHTGEKPYKCDFCDQSFLSASRRKDHVERNHIGASFDCEYCDAKYNARRSLLKHRKKHFENAKATETC